MWILKECQKMEQKLNHSHLISVVLVGVLFPDFKNVFKFVI